MAKRDSELNVGSDPCTMSKSSWKLITMRPRINGVGGAGPYCNERLQQEDGSVVGGKRVEEHPAAMVGAGQFSRFGLLGWDENSADNGPAEATEMALAPGEIWVVVLTPNST